MPGLTDSTRSPGSRNTITFLMTETISRELSRKYLYYKWTKLIYL